MARCKLTNMNLRNIRKSKEYQCLLIDLVKASVIGKSAAEELLGYTIPAGLLGSSTPVTPDDDDKSTSGSGTEGSGTEGSGTEQTPVMVTVKYGILGSDLAGDVEYTADVPSGSTLEQALAYVKADYFAKVNANAEEAGGEPIPAEAFTEEALLIGYDDNGFVEASVPEDYTITAETLDEDGDPVIGTSSYELMYSFTYNPAE